MGGIWERGAEDIGEIYVVMRQLYTGTCKKSNIFIH